MGQPQTIPPYPVERGDELSLIELWKILVNYKLLIVGFTVLTTLSAIYYASTLPTIYKADVLMIPTSGGVSGGGLSNRLGGLASMAGVSLGVGSSAGVEGEQALARLKTRIFLNNYIKEQNLKPILFAEQWNKETKHWIDEQPSDREASELLSEMIITSMDPRDRSGLVIFSLEWKDPIDVNKIADVANSLVNSMNINAKQRAIVEAKNSISFLEKELEQTSILNSQTILYSMIEQQMQKIMLANVRDEYVFKVIDPAVIPKYAKNKPTLIIIFIGMILGLFFGSFTAVSANFIQKK